MKIISNEYKGKFLSINKIAHNGEEKNPYEIVDIKDGVGVLVFNPLEKKILLVKQIRDVFGETLEIPAGMLDKPLSKENILLEELEEECEMKFEKENLKSLGYYFPMIGCCTHKIYLYFIEYNGECIDKKVNDKDVYERIWIDIEEFTRKIEANEIIDSKTQISFLNAILKDYL